jgi:hypothetical protein
MCSEYIAMEHTIDPFVFISCDRVVKNLKGMSLKICVDLLTFSQIGSKGFCNLELLDLREVSPTVVENYIQGKNLNNVKWFYL